MNLGYHGLTVLRELMMKWLDREKWDPIAQQTRGLEL